MAFVWKNFQYQYMTGVLFWSEVAEWWVKNKISGKVSSEVLGKIDTIGPLKSSAGKGKKKLMFKQTKKEILEYLSIASK